MSWSCEMHRDGELIELPYYPYEMSIGVTYNYGKFFRKYNGDISLADWLNGKTGQETAEILLPVINQMKNDYTETYWDQTEGNARKALIKLLAMSLCEPDAVWDID